MCMLSSSFVDRFFPYSATIPAASLAKEIPDIVERKKTAANIKKPGFLRGFPKYIVEEPRK